MLFTFPYRDTAHYLEEVRKKYPLPHEGVPPRRARNEQSSLRLRRNTPRRELYTPTQVMDIAVAKWLATRAHVVRFKLDGHRYEITADWLRYWLRRDGEPFLSRCHDALVDQLRGF